MFIFLFNAYVFCLCKKGRSIYAKRREVFGEFIYVYFLIYAYMCCLVYGFIEYLYCFDLCKKEEKYFFSLHPFVDQLTKRGRDIFGV